MQNQTVNSKNTIGENVPKLSGYKTTCSCGGHIKAEVMRNGFPGLTLSYKCDACNFVLHAIEQ